MTHKAKSGALDRFADILTLLGGWTLLVLAGLVTFEVLARKFFLFSVKGVDEIGGYVLAISGAVGFAYAVMTRSHVRVDLLLSSCGPRLRSILEWVAALGMVVLAYSLLWRTVYVVIRTVSLNASASTPLHTPLIYPQGAWALGLAFFAIVATIALWQATVAMMRGEVADADKISALDDEIQAEVADAARRLKDISK